MMAFALAVAGACGGDDGSSNVPSSSSSGTGSTSSSSSGGGGGAAPAGCNDDPFQCPAGETCGVTQGNAFKCLPSGQGASGDTCQSFIDLPECGDGLLCVQLEMAQSGVCAPFCDATNPCAGGVRCVILELKSGAQINACYSDEGGSGGAGGGGGN